jgi:hypothetical protein
VVSFNQNIQGLKEIYKGKQARSAGNGKQPKATKPNGRGLSIYQFSKSYFVFPVNSPYLNQPENRGKVFCAGF